MKRNEQKTRLRETLARLTEQTGEKLTEKQEQNYETKRAKTRLRETLARLTE